LQVADAAQLNDHLPMTVRLKGSSRNGTVNIAVTEFLCMP